MVPLSDITEVDYIWKNGELVPWAEATTHVLSHSLHYGSGVFEGIRCYKVPDEDKSYVFRLRDHMERLHRSCKIAQIELPYSVDELMDAIQDHIAPLKGETAWGYTPAYFLSARYNLHRDYAEHYLDKGDLTNRDINHILAGFDRSKATAYDKDYADRLYREYQNRAIDDTAALDTLRTAFGGKTVLVLAPGASLAEEAGRNAVAAAKADCIVSANFCPEFCQPDYAFFTNSKRFEKLDLAALPCPVVLTSNLRPLPQGALAVNYDRLAAPDVQNASLGSNSVLMLLRLLRLCGAKAVLLAGADGYKPGTPAYADSLLHAHTGRGAAFNTAMAGAIKACGLDVTFITPSEYAK